LRVTDDAPVTKTRDLLSTFTPTTKKKEEF
jgi:hypothetical protein